MALRNTRSCLRKYLSERWCEKSAQAKYWQRNSSNSQKKKNPPPHQNGIFQTTTIIWLYTLSWSPCILQILLTHYKRHHSPSIHRLLPINNHKVLWSSGYDSRLGFYQKSIARGPRFESGQDPVLLLLSGLLLGRGLIFIVLEGLEALGLFGLGLGEHVADSNQIDTQAVGRWLEETL
jgi:hypothetical protein